MLTNSTDITRPAGPLSVVDAYAEHFAASMIDLSCPSPPAPAGATLDAATLARADLGYAHPGGSSALRARIAARHRTLDRDDVLVTNGASEALAALALALGGAGRRVAVGAGTFPSFTEIARTAGTTVLEAASASLDGCSAVVATNPTVPAGRWIDVRGFVAEAVAHGATPVVDEVYRELALDGRPAPAAADLDARAVSVGDLSKPLGLGGLRIGWIATRDVTLRSRVAHWLRLLGAGPSVLSEAAALSALDTFDDTLAGHVGRAAERTPAVLRVLADAGWRCEPADAGLTVLATPPRPVSDDALAALRASGRFLLRADAFGAPGAFRVALLADPDALRHALARLARHDAPPGTLVVLMRAPRPGFGKTRLAAGIGVDRAAVLARAFVVDTLDVAARGPWRRLVAFTPPGAADEVAALAPGVQAVGQADGDLGARIAGALGDAARAGGPAVLIGSDTPDLDPALIARAFAALGEADVVLGPAADGGFYLIGVRPAHAQRLGTLFDGVAWSTERVFAQVRANVAHAGLSLAVLDEWADVDDAGSLDALARRLDASGGGASDGAAATRAALATLLSGARR